MDSRVKWSDEGGNPGSVEEGILEGESGHAKVKCMHSSLIEKNPNQTKFGLSEALGGVGCFLI